MSIARSGLLALASAAMTLAAAWLSFTGLENFPGVVRLAAIILSVFCVGAGLGFFVPGASGTAVGTGAFAGLLILWLPVIAATYGFALMALPVLFALALIASIGAGVGRRRRLARSQASA